MGKWLFMGCNTNPTRERVSQGASEKHTRLPVGLVMAEQRVLLLAASIALFLIGIARFPLATFASDPSDRQSSSSKETPAVDETKLPASTVTKTLNVFPPSISISGSAGSQGVVAQMVEIDSISRDVTTDAEWKMKDERIARYENGRVFPVSDGQTVLVAAVGDLTARVDVTIADANVTRPVSFLRDVMPVFARAGCNAGSCHGAARGKDGFRLSLFGFDPKGDLYRLMHELPGRRVDVASPDDCLLINKSTLSVPHSGGEVFKRDSKYYRTIRDWIAQGATFDEEPVSVESIELYPQQAVLRGAGQQQPLAVTATWSDGTVSDVTDLATFSETNGSVARVSVDGVVESHLRGESFVMARFENHTVGADFISLPAASPGDQQRWAKSKNRTPRAVNFVDHLIDQKLDRLRITRSPLCDDATFIRRVTIDLSGTVPTAEEVIAFCKDPSAGKRSALIERLLQSDGFTRIWVLRFAEMLQIRSNRNVSVKATHLYHQWLKEQFQRSVPVDQIVTQLLCSTGSTFTSPESNFYEMEKDGLKIAENVAQSFMGTRIQCAQCHNHPFDRWTMDDYYSFAAFFSGVGRKNLLDPRERFIVGTVGRKVKHPLTNKVMQPKFLGGPTPEIGKTDRRRVLADWLTDSANPYFSRNLSNIVWAHFFGRGIVDEVDDVRISNPPVNKPLLDALATRLSDGHYDLKIIVRDICNSATYQAGSQANENNASDQTNFSHARLRRMKAEVMADVIAKVTDSPNRIKGLARGDSALNIPDASNSSHFLKTFGRGTRATVCACETKAEPTLSQSLHLINGETVEKKIRNGKLIDRWRKNGLSNEAIVRRLYLRVLNREVTDTEIATLSTAIAADAPAAAQKEFLEDVFWALLNSSEFLFNH